MKRLLLVLVLVVACGVALGFYRGWFHIGSDNVDGKSNITLSVDQNKIQEDGKAAQEKVQDLGQPKHKTEGPTEKSKN